MKKVLLLSALLTVFSWAGTVRVAVAANVSYAIDTLIAAFNETHPDTRIRTVLGSSGKLTAQIQHGAPLHLFLSANMQYPEALYENGLALLKPEVYTEGTLALFSVKSYDLSKGLQLLTDENIRRIAIANPKTAPYGVAAYEALQTQHLYDKLKTKFIFGESISQTVSYAVTAADIGIIATSSLYSKQMQKYKKGVHWEEVDPSLYTRIKQGIVLLKPAQGNEEAKAFYQFVLSPKAQKILSQYGYHSP